MVANEVPDTGTFNDPCQWPSRYARAGRTSSTVAPSGGIGNSTTAAAAATCGPRFSSTSRLMFGGFGAEIEAESATKSASVSIWSAGLKRRSKPIVEEPLELIALPQSEPATWPGNTSTPSGRSSNRRSEWKSLSAPSCAPTARSGRAASPTKSESPVRTSHASSARERSITARHVCSGRWPGVWIARSTTAPSSTCGAVVERVVLVRGLGGRMDRDRHSVLEREPPVPREMVGMGVRLDRPHDRDVALRRFRQHRLDRIGRIDDRRNARILVADQIRGTAEVVVNELLEQHES